MKKEKITKEEKSYGKRVHKILKTYNTILVKCKNIPMLYEKNIIKVEDMNSMINAQIETKKPIIYFQEEKSTSFMLLDGNEIYVYIVKENEEIQSEVEDIINNYEIVKSTFMKEFLTKGNMLAGSALKYLEGGKEENSKEKNKTSPKGKNNKKSESTKEIENTDTERENKTTKKKTISKKSAKKSEEEDDDATKNLYLVPVKSKKTDFLKSSKKSKKEEEKKEKGGRRTKIK